MYEDCGDWTEDDLEWVWEEVDHGFKTEKIPDIEFEKAKDIYNKLKSIKREIQRLQLKTPQEIDINKEVQQ